MGQSGWAATVLLIAAAFQTTKAGFACLNNPCYNGICIDDINGNFSCFCIDGFTGFLCETNWDECWSGPCLNGGTCNDGIAQFNCTCPSGYQGALCEEITNECESNPCQNNGTCIDLIDSFSCNCHPGYYGDQCEQDMSVCNTTESFDRCANGGQCIEGPGLTFYCQCQLGWEGERCEIPINECASSPCRNGAICVDLHANYSCACSFGYTGRDCEQELIICGEDSNCENGALCLVEGLEPLNICYCVPDFHGDHCQYQYDECELDPKPKCKNGGTCIDGVDSYTCSCPPDLTGEHCECLMLDNEELNCSYVRPPWAFTTHVPTEVPTTTLLEETTTEIEEEMTTPEGKTTLSPFTQTVLCLTSMITQSNVSDSTMTDEITSVKSTTLEGEETTTALDGLFTTTELITNCKTSGCFNGGVCSSTRDGLQCICPSGWEGNQCEIQSAIKIAAFSGQSYIAHRLNTTRIQLTLRTLSPDGLILYEDIVPGTYLALYLENGLLKFRFSCGKQTMLLSEVQFPINNGYDMTINVNLDFLPLGFCLGTVRVNNTLAMSGEQVSKKIELGNFLPTLYLGGVPLNVLDLVPITEGFVGCMFDLRVENFERNILNDSLENFNIKECTSLACLSNPCINGATCLETNKTWTCACPSGFLGKKCEKSVCEDNPCEYGGTCTLFPGSGFICLCPYGKHGQFCESDLDIGQSCYSSTVGGLSSFSAHPLPVDIQRNMILSFRFIPHDFEQIALMAFIGQDGLHGPTSDHLSVSFIKGYIVFTWNLGSGPRRIFTSGPINNKPRQTHVVHLGRLGPDAWLAVDDFQNVTGKSPGPLTQLNTRPILYLGGHHSRNFSQLPHDLPLHTGFSGCIFDAKLQISHTVILLQQTKQISGRGVGQCGTSLCHEHACLNGGGCIHQGATFSCICADGWFGPNCALRYNPCDNTRHNCSNGSTCVPTFDSYTCDCPLGRIGKYCEIAQELSDVSLRGVRSYLKVAIDNLNDPKLCFELEVKPIVNSGLLLYVGDLNKQGAFFSLSLQGGVLELRVSIGRFVRRGDPLTIRSRRLLALGQWHKIRAGRYGRRLFLWVEGTVNTGLLLPGEALPTSETIIYIGGVPDLSNLPLGAVAGHVVPFQGCVRRLTISQKWIPLNTTTILDARNIEDCDGNSCGGDVCDHGGSCHLDKANAPQCTCTKEYSGPRCEQLVSCLEVPCRNGGRCLSDGIMAHRCACLNGWTGLFCEESISVETPLFNGDSYLIVDRIKRSASRKKDALTSSIPLDFVYLNFTTVESHGLILWTATYLKDKYLGIGVDKGNLKLVWKWPGTKPHVFSGPKVNDGLWHDLAINFANNVMTIWSDHQLMHTENLSQVNGLESNGIYYIGGFPRGTPITKTSQGHFNALFLGCVQKLAWTTDQIFTNFSGLSGENVGLCDSHNIVT